ncbi:GFA family protein [Marilutibacter chinensis]|uniref:GFA family protein n=1 Tax=Marilutibacter chinensis TaxID=2912247 RepID=A0ABS9HV12_9GAMM|nr:GFA family protein [Lysobacter chinensis]MCF7222736.1 GFA family protein [Lysobacter chinensis]
MDPSSAKGSCLCGSVRFSARMPARWVAHCHCTRCQRAHGAAFVTWAGMEAGRVSIDDPSSTLRWHVADEGGQRGFCSRCGSPMFFKGDRWPGELHVARALFADDLEQLPQVHAYYDTHVDWFEVADALPKKPAPEA